MDSTGLSELQLQLQSEREANLTLQKQQELSLSQIDALSTQLKSAKTQIHILCDEACLDKDKLNEMMERMEFQTQQTLEYQTQIKIMRSLNSSINSSSDDDDKKHVEKNQNENKITKYQKEIESLQQKLTEKNHEIRSLSSSLQSLKVNNHYLQNRMNELQQIQNEQQSSNYTVSDQLQTIQKFEKENNELLNLTQQLKQERDELMDHIHTNKDEDTKLNDDSVNNNDIIRVPYEYKDTIRRRRRTLSVQSIPVHALYIDTQNTPTDTTFTAFPPTQALADSRSDLMQNNSMFIDTLNKNELLSIINRCNDRLRDTNPQNSDCGNKVRGSNEEEDGDNVTAKKELCIDEEEEKSDTLSELEADGEIHENDHEEKLIQQELSNCDIRTNTLLIMKKMLLRFQLIRDPLAE